MKKEHQAKEKMHKYLEELKESGVYDAMQMRAFRAKVQEKEWNLNGWNVSEYGGVTTSKFPQDVLECPSFCDCTAPKIEEDSSDSNVRIDDPKPSEDEPEPSGEDERKFES